MSERNIELIDMGNLVVCDFCNTDYSKSDECGGMLFSGSAVCPKCTPRIEADARSYGESRFIKARCPLDKPFRKWVLEDLRQGNNMMRIITFPERNQLNKTDDENTKGP